MSVDVECDEETFFWHLLFDGMMMMMMQKACIHPDERTHFRCISCRLPSSYHVYCWSTHLFAHTFLYVPMYEFAEHIYTISSISELFMVCFIGKDRGDDVHTCSDDPQSISGAWLQIWQVDSSNNTEMRWHVIHYEYRCTSACHCTDYTQQGRLCISIVIHADGMIIDGLIEWWVAT